MKKVTKALDKSINELNEYLQAFNFMLPMGDGAKICAIEEWKNVCNKVVVNVKNLEKRQIELIEKN